MPSFRHIRSPWIAAAIGLFLWAPACGAFTVSGTVTSGGKPVAGVRVQMPDLNRSEITAEDGTYRFSNVPKGSYSLFAGLIGYTSATQHVEIKDADIALAIEIKPRAIPLEELVISASPYPRPADEQYQSAESRSLVPFLNSPGGSFADKLSDLPSVRHAGGGGRDLPCGRGPWAGDRAVRTQLDRRARESHLRRGSERLTAEAQRHGLTRRQFGQQSVRRVLEHHSQRRKARLFLVRRRYAHRGHPDSQGFVRGSGERHGL